MPSDDGMAPRMGAVLPARAGRDCLAPAFFKPAFFGAALAIGPTTRAGFLTAGVARRTGILRATAFFGAAFLAPAFFKPAFFGAAFLEAAFFGATFLTAAFLAATFFEPAFLEAAFFAAVFLAVALFGAAFFFADLAEAFFAAFFTTVLRPAIFRFAIARSPEVWPQKPARNRPQTSSKHARLVR